MMNCPNCQAANPADARFCMNCGSPLGRGATGSPKPLTEPGQPQAPLAGERRILTALFMDVVGSTALAEKMDPEDWTVIMNRAFDRVVPVILQYEGTVARLQGDSLLAFFGAPVAHEDDAIRAAHAALDILAAAHTYAEDLSTMHGIEFAVRVGLNTGLVVVGEVGSRQAYEYTAMGDAVNLAARLQAAARPMTVWTTDSTFRFIAPLFDCADLGEMQFRGKSEPVRVYEILSRKTQPERLRGLPGPGPMVGRQDELQDLLKASEDVAAGAGRAALVIGEAGIGKSRLVAEWKRSAPAGMRWVEARCLSYGQGLPYQLIADWIRSLVGLQGSAPVDRIEDGLELLAQHVPTGAESGARLFLRHLLALPISEEQQKQLEATDPQALQRGYQAVLEDLLVGYANESPLAVILDDLHWCDPSSAELFSRTLAVLHRAPVLFCMVTRNDLEAPGWSLVRAARQMFDGDLVEIPLQSLSIAESSQLVSNLLDIKTLPKALDGLVLSKAEGNPLFVEEVLRMLVDQSVLVQSTGQWQVLPFEGSLVIPGSLLGLLQARIDRLPAAARQVLRAAAVIGRTFQTGLLQSVLSKTGQDILPLSQLGQLESAGFIRPLRSGALDSYDFRHALVQEAVYASILKSELRLLHRAIGEIIESASEVAIPDAALLAFHFSNAGDDPRALKYYSLAGKQAASQFAAQEALEHFSRAIDLANKLKVSPAELYNARGKLLEILGRFDEAVADLEKARQSAQAYGESELELQSLLNLGFAWASRDYGQTGDYFQQALTLARRLEEPLSLAQALNRVGNWHTNLDQPDLAMSFHHEALAIYQEALNQEGIGETLDLLGMNNALGGFVDRAWTYTEQAIEIFREVNNLPGLASGLTSLAIGSSYYETGSTYTNYLPIELGRASIDEALEICRRINWTSGEAYSLSVLAGITAAHGDYGQALETADAAFRTAQQIGHLQWQTAAQFGLALVDREILAYSQAHSVLESALALARQTGSANWIKLTASETTINGIQLGLMDEAQSVLDITLNPDEPALTLGQRNLWIARALLAAARGRPEQALEQLEHLDRWNRASSSDGVSIYISLVRGNALAIQQSWEEAAAEFKRLSDYSVLENFPGISWRCQIGLGRIYRAQSLAEQAQEAYRQAAETVEALAARLPGGELRENFLQRFAELTRPSISHWPTLLF